MRDRGPVIFTDTKWVPHIDLLVQAAAVSSNREVLFSDYIHHDYATVEDIWLLALEKNRKPLNAIQARSLRKAFGAPSQEKPQGSNLRWLANEWYKLKSQSPQLKAVEWSSNRCDQKMYRLNLENAGYDVSLILPAPSDWTSAAYNWRYTLPSLQCFHLSYNVCSLRSIRSCMACS